jgi:hypothetical protein
MKPILFLVLCAALCACQTQKQIQSGQAKKLPVRALPPMPPYPVPNPSSMPVKPAITIAPGPGTTKVTLTWGFVPGYDLYAVIATQDFKGWYWIGQTQTNSFAMTRTNAQEYFKVWPMMVLPVLP